MVFLCKKFVHFCPLFYFLYYHRFMSVYEKNGKWYYKCQVFGIRKHGSCRGCRNISEALEFEAEIKNEISLLHRGKKDLSEIISLNEMFKMFLSYSKTNNSIHQYEQNIHKVDVFNNYFGSNTVISDVKPMDIENFKSYLKSKGLKNSSINRYYSSLSKAFNLLIINKKLNIQNPCKLVSKLKEDNEIMRYLKPEEEERLMKELAPHLKPIVICALQTGLRLSNILNLKWESVNLDVGFIEILKQENKGHKKIQIPISNKLKSVFYTLYDNNSEFVFTFEGKSLSSIKTGFKKACERAGIENLRFHDLRHTVGTRLVANGADLQTVKEILAHSSLTTTQRYLHPVKENLKKAVDILDSF